MSRLVIQPQKTPLNGTVRVPGDKSISHRAAMLASIAQGTSHVYDWLPAGDTIATLELLRSLAVPIHVKNKSDLGWDLQIEGRGLTGLTQPAHALDCRNAGTCIRLMAGILAGQPFASTLDGSEQLRKRPMGRIVTPLKQMGAKIESSNNQPPLKIQGAKLNGISYELPVASAQVKSAILLAGLYAKGETRVHEPGPTRDHTERLLEAMGVELHFEDNWIVLKPPGGFSGKSGLQPVPSQEQARDLKPLEITVPGDQSSGAFVMIAAALVPHSRVIIEGVGVNQTRTGLLDIIGKMGGNVRLTNQHITGGEPVGDLFIHFEELHSTQVSGYSVVRAIDEFPIWAVAATQAAGVSTLRDAAELRLKEVDRIALLAGELVKMGVTIQEYNDGFTITGPIRLRGAYLDCYGDHRLAMALAVAAMIADTPSQIEDADCISDSFPGFVGIMRSIGANMAWDG